MSLELDKLVQLTAYVRSLSFEIRWLRKAAERAYPPTPEDLEQQKKEIEMLRR